MPAIGDHLEKALSRRGVYFRWGLMAVSAVVFAAAVWAAIKYRALKLPKAPEKTLLSVDPTASGNTIVAVPGDKLLADLADFDDGFFAFLMFDYYRSQPDIRDNNVLLISQESNGKTVYRVLVALPSDLIAGIDTLARWRYKGLIEKVDYEWRPPSVVQRYLAETTLFAMNFRSPAQRSFEHFHGKQLEAYVRRFIRFKSSTDPRVLEGTIPSPLTSKQANQLAADIIAVAKFYDIPLELMIGIGAMENNYMSVPGDLKNTKWKRRAQPGDIVIRRERHRVLVKDDSAGVWQITRESLRYAHRLYLEDHRDYSELPERLRPPRVLDIDHVSDEVLTTYAGLLLRNLLDRFHGDPIFAAGAYNGGVDHPNLHYASGVEAVASYARRVIERAIEVNQAERSRSASPVMVASAKTP